MKKTIRKYFITTILLSSFIIGLLFAVKSVQADNDNSTDIGFSAKLDLYYATYGDYDKDGMEDDCYFEGKLFLNSNKDMKSYWYLKLELPSGKTFCFAYECIIESNDEIKVKIYTFNTAIESGWYKGTLYCSLQYNDNLSYCLRDSIIFDPPEEIGPKDPDSIFIIG